MSQWNSGFIAEVKQHGGLYIDRVAKAKQADNALGSIRPSGYSHRGLLPSTLPSLRSCDTKAVSGDFS